MFEYAEPTSEAEMRERYAAVTRRCFKPVNAFDESKKREAQAKAKVWASLIFHHDAHVVAYRNELKHRLIVSEFKLVGEQQRRPSVQDIINEEAAKAGVSADDIRGTRRFKPIVEARFRAIARAYQERPDLTLPTLGRLFGNRDHTSILHAVKKMGVHRQTHVYYTR